MSTRYIPQPTSRCGCTKKLYNGAKMCMDCKAEEIWARYAEVVPTSHGSYSQYFTDAIPTSSRISRRSFGND